MGLDVPFHSLHCDGDQALTITGGCKRLALSSLRLEQVLGLESKQVGALKHTKEWQNRVNFLRIVESTSLFNDLMYDGLI